MVLKSKNTPPPLLLWHALFSTILLIYRAIDSQSITYLFLLWNLFLAYVPWFIATLIRTGNPAIINFVLLGVWLLFFPNAPYLITDFIHLHLRPSYDFWLDLSIFFSFALNGMAIGFLSLHRVFKWLKSNSSKWLAWLITHSALTLSAFGIYLGRIERWNSWDLLVQPDTLLRAIYSLLNPGSGQWHVFYFTVLFGAFLSMHYYFFLYISELIKVDQNEDPV
ncbi:MAG: DUF1361 domain-containing protein [Flavobacteriales bacterium]|nr:DUF1361 domain-containing protein [Flavobacteriales bacterium]